jgi:tRNA (guanine37-N1)-methyltransferase
MRAIFITLFPGMLEPVLGQSMLKRAADKGLLSAEVVNLRQFAGGRHQIADDSPYGGGPGMVLKPEPIFDAVESVMRREGAVRLVLTSPQGRPLSPDMARDLAAESRPLLFLCGHYEGIDERVLEGLAPEEISIGDYVLTGGELASLVIVDAAIRWIPGVLGDPDGASQDSFSETLFDHPHYTRPAAFRGMEVPSVLRSGDHQAIARWRRQQALERTRRQRPELLSRASLTEEERAWVAAERDDLP